MNLKGFVPKLKLRGEEKAKQSNFKSIPAKKNIESISCIHYSSEIYSNLLPDPIVGSFMYDIIIIHEHIRMTLSIN